MCRWLSLASTGHNDLPSGDLRTCRKEATINNRRTAMAFRPASLPERYATRPDRAPYRKEDP